MCVDVKKQPLPTTRNENNVSAMSKRAERKEKKRKGYYLHQSEEDTGKSLGRR